MIWLLISTAFCLFFIAYHHAGYPLLLNVLRKLSKQQELPPLTGRPYSYDVTVSKTTVSKTTSSEKKAPETEVNKISETRPFISIFIPAYNEEKYIEEKLRNLACLDYPASRFEVVVACDGCTDNTAEIARACSTLPEFQGLRIRVLEFRVNRGKCAVINKVLPTLKGQIIALSDVSALVSIDALRIAAQRFESPDVGAVNGNYRLLNPGNAGEEKYWQYQSNIKRGEETLGSVLGAHGAFYLIRKALFRQLQENTINDDFIIPMRAIEFGFKVVYEPRINAIELEKSNDELNWSRRQRIGMGNVQQLLVLHRLFSLKNKGVAFAFFSGKGLRVLMPFMMIYSLLASVILSANTSNFPTWLGAMVIVCLLAQLVVYGLAAYAALVGSAKAGRLAKTAHYLISGHFANFIGASRYLLQSKTQW